MINPVTYMLLKEDGTKQYILIEPMLEKADGILKSTGIFKLYKDAVGDESAIFTEPLEIDKGPAKLPDAANPDYIGMISFINDNWAYRGNLLTKAEQSQIAFYIQKHK